jgi:poly-gamma-glutamate capsule biosynthesis protein CapA/YwtB (metallophosphatase superfamily)
MIHMTARLHRQIIAIVGSAALFASTAAIAQLAQGPSSNPDEFLRTPPKPAKVKGTFSVVSVGDLLYTAPQAGNDDAELKKVIDIIHSGDVAIANQEGMAFDLNTFKGSAYGAGQVYGQPTLASDYHALGINMISMANNHAADWGPEGLLDSARLLDEAGVAHAGGGHNLQEARGAGVFNTPKGRVALVATASTFKVNAGANDTFRDVPGRPGISTLRTRIVQLVTPEEMEKIRSLGRTLASPLNPAPPADAQEVTFGDRTYRVSDRRGLHYDMDLYDHAGLLKAVREAKDNADLVVFTIHAHESPTGIDDDTPAPPDFLIKLSHDAVDAGADVVMGGGPHSLRGIEIYKGKPVLYGLGLFFFKPAIKAMQETAFRRFPPSGYPGMPDPRPTNPPSWYDSVMAVTDLEGGKVERVRLYPIDLLNTGTPARRGLPHLADPEKARRILTTLQDESAQFGTNITIDGSVGVVRVP